MKSSLIFLSLLAVQSSAQEPPCGLSSIQETNKPIYPPIARAAHVTGNVILLVEFSQDGSVKESRALSGPEMLKASAHDYVVSWKANPYAGSRTCPIVIQYELGDTTAVPPQIDVIRTDAQHVRVIARSLVISDPAGVLGYRRHWYWPFHRKSS